MTNSENRRRWTAEEKLAVVKAHLTGAKTVSQICEEYGVSPSLYYKWQTTLFENGAQCLERKSTASGKKRESSEIAKLQAQLETTQNKLTEKHEVLSELMSEHIRLKKLLGIEFSLGGTKQTRPGS